MSQISTWFHLLCFTEKLPWYLIPLKYLLFVVLGSTEAVTGVIAKIRNIFNRR